ncbi:hypothetical protein [Burkholderia ambifaria]|uniref:hypothetical protein n=1 Tax=Burkholderia ambifaria TaxID=152480 RepID=UPI00158E6D42|nr:hypothetical protein [Burkholderia ambifaria]
MDEIECRKLFESAIDSLCQLDEYLLRVDASERSISHRLAMHLTSRFPNFDVDCEYNRDGFDVKRLALSGREVRDDDIDAVTVFPDIVVHKRGHNKSNLLVVEMKKGSSNVSPQYDLEKLEAFRRELGYRHSVHCTIGYGRDGSLVRRVVWAGPNERRSMPENDSR